MRNFRDDEVEVLPIKSVDPDEQEPYLSTQEQIINSRLEDFQPETFVDKIFANINWIRLYFLPVLLLLFIFFASGDVDRPIKLEPVQHLSLEQTTYKLFTIYDNVTEKKVVTSSQLKFPPENKYKEKLQSFMTSLKQKTYLNDTKFSTKSPQRISTEPPRTAPLKQFMQDAKAKLKNPEYPEYLHEIMSYLPYQELPFCLIVRQVLKTSKTLQEDIAKSIFSLNYTNYITIFIGFEDQGIQFAVLEKILNQSQYGKQKVKKMFYKINYQGPNYYEYKLLMHELCAPKSVVMFVNSVLNPTALTVLNNFHQLYPVYMTYSENIQKFLPSSFLMRVFDLIGANDFGNSNRKYFQLSGQEKLFSVSMFEFCSRFVKKFPMALIYKQESLNEETEWIGSVKKQESQIYTRYAYQPLVTLSQSAEIDVEAKRNVLNGLKNNSEQYQPDPRTELATQQMFQAIQCQQSVFFPPEYSINKKQYAQSEANYGAQLKFDKPYVKPLPERPFCVVFLGNNQTGVNAEKAHRYVRSVRAILRQNYTNFHIVYMDDGVLSSTQAKVVQSVKQSGFPSDRFLYIKNRKTMYPIFNIIRASFQFCQPEEMQVILDSDFQIIDSNFLTLVNKVNGYNPNLWVINTNFKTDKHKFGYSYRIEHDYEYRDFEGRVRDLRYLSPVPVWEVKLIRSIPLRYHLDANNEWMKDNWHKALQHSITELATMAHIQYIPQISFEVSDNYSQEYFNSELYAQSINHIISQKVLQPLSSLNSKYSVYEHEIKQNIAKQVSSVEEAAKSTEL